MNTTPYRILHTKIALRNRARSNGISPPTPELIAEGERRSLIYVIKEASRLEWEWEIDEVTGFRFKEEPNGA